MKQKFKTNMNILGKKSMVMHNRQRRMLSTSNIIDEFQQSANAVIKHEFIICEKEDGEEETRIFTHNASQLSARNSQHGGQRRSMMKLIPINKTVGQLSPRDFYRTADAPS